MKRKQRQDREFVAKEIKAMRAAVRSLEAYFKMTKRQHRKLNLGNGCYDPIEYHTQQVMTHAAMLRTCIEQGEPFAIELPDGTIMTTRGGKGNNRGKRADIPLKYLVAVQNNPDSTLSPDEMKIRYMNMGKCGR